MGREGGGGGLHLVHIATGVLSGWGGGGLHLFHNIATGILCGKEDTFSSYSYRCF